MCGEAITKEGLKTAMDLVVVVVTAKGVALTMLLGATSDATVESGGMEDEIDTELGIAAVVLATDKADASKVDSNLF